VTFRVEALQDLARVCGLDATSQVGCLQRNHSIVQSREYSCEIGFAISQSRKQNLQTDVLERGIWRFLRRREPDFYFWSRSNVSGSHLRLDVSIEILLRSGR
jgi:hypothetical protein